MFVSSLSAHSPQNGPLFLYSHNLSKKVRIVQSLVLRGDLLLWALGCASGCTDRWMVLIAGFPTHHLRAPELQYSRQGTHVFDDSLKAKDVCDKFAMKI